MTRKFSYKLIEEENTYSLLVFKDDSAMVFDIKEFITLGKSVLKMLQKALDDKEATTFASKIENAQKNWASSKK